WADIDLEADIGEGRGDDMLTAVVAVLAKLGDEDARPAAVVLLEAGDEAGGLGERGGVLADLAAIDARNDAGVGAVTPENILERLADLADGGVGARRANGEFEEVGAALGTLAERGKRSLGGGRVARRAETLQLFDLRAAHRAVVDAERFERRLVCRTVAVDADQHLLAGIDPRLRAGGGFLDPQLRQAALDRLRHAAEGVDLGDMATGAGGEVGSQALDEGRTAPRVDHLGRP